MKLSAFCSIVLAITAAAGQEAPEAQPAKVQVESLSLPECLQRAAVGNHKHKISLFAVSLAEAQHRQALSGYWPQVNLKAGIQRSDQAVNFLFPTQTVGIPPQQIPVPGGAALVTIPANAFGPGFPPANVQLPVAYPGQVIRTPAEALVVQSQNLKIADRDLASGSLNATLLIFDGGLRKGLREQTSAGTNAMLAEAKRTDLDVAEAVTRFYWAAVLARELKAVGDDTLARLETTLQLTDVHAKSGSGKITKSDYLYNKVVVESARSAVVELEKNQILAQAALANTMGMPWNVSVAPRDEQLPTVESTPELAKLVSECYRTNPEWTELEAGLRAARGALKTKRSDYYPKLALKGDLHSFWNGGFNGGLSTSQNRFGWTVGAGVEVPIFNGLLTQSQVSESLLKIQQLRETQLLLKDGLGLQVKSIIVELQSARKIYDASAAAMKAAVDNRELNMSAYENDMAEPDKVIQAQIIAALAAAEHSKAQYEQATLLSRLSAVVGHQGIGEALPTTASRPQP